jgi:GTP-binding protein Era
VIVIDWQDFASIPPGHKSGFVAVVGRPNVGKSTLINHLVGQKVAIVSPKPQTTRSRILAILTREDAQVIFVDTPGLHRPHHKLGEAMVATATRAIPDADVALFIVDVSVPPTQEDRMIAELIQEQTNAPVILVLNKMDLLPADKVELHTEAYWALVGIPSHSSLPPKGVGVGEGWMMTTATKGVNLDKLLEMIVDTLPEGPPYYPSDQVTDQTEREIAAELVREQVLRHTRQEIPHSVAVVVEEFKERENDVVYIAANVFVEKRSQKGIIIGRGEIERMTGGRIYLDLWVKVKKDWRQDGEELRRLGYDVRGS